MLYAHFGDIPPNAWRWANFSPDEPNLACPCCGELYLCARSMDMLQTVRDLLGKPVRINSGHRCKLHNARVGGAPRSMHKLEIAFDISLRGHDRGDVLAACRLAGFTTFGFYNTFLHTDIRPGRRWYSGATARRLWAGIS